MTLQEARPKVFRLRNLPDQVTSLSETAHLLGRCLRIPAHDVEVYSIARTTNIWEVPPSKVATLQLKSEPGDCARLRRSDEWEILLPEARGRRLILDCHFEGLTALNDLKPEEHQTDCIAISGLDSHAFGSWQPRGPDKSYMWIRDEIPQSIPGTRSIIYGYNSKLIGSASFQTVKDIALALIHQLKTGGWNLQSAKPIVFLAHSLGGLVLKDAIVQMADREIAAPILNKIQGILMFGVPNLGMHVSHLMAMTEGQINDTLVQDLSRENGSAYLRQLNKSFEGLRYIQHMQIYWAYETKETPTAKKLSNGEWEKNGPFAILVSPDSATCHQNTTSKSMTIPIDENHSDMVKYPPGHNMLATIITCLSELCSQRSTSGVSTSLLSKGPSRAPQFAKNLVQGVQLSHISNADKETLKQLDTLNSSIKSMYTEIYSPELDFRLDQIDCPYEDTFQWVFEQPSFCNWLQYGSGLFWVNGKPGSGKSTLMKYIFKSRHTWELVHDWRRGSADIKEIKAGFFFHYRGTASQKSFEGLLRSLLVQLLEPYIEKFKSFSETVHEVRKRETSIINSMKEAEKHLRNQKLEHAVLATASGTNHDATKNGGENERTSKDLEDAVGKKMAELRQVERTLSKVATEFRKARKEPEGRFLLELTAVFEGWGQEILLHKLEKTLCYIMDQDGIKLDLVLFFDALDEFDGHQDMISRFLKSLVRNQDGSTTRVKICFSSRPWKSFQGHFSEYPSLRLHDYTKYDIEKYTAGNMALHKKEYPDLLDLAPIIVKKANGVFLWVKLAVQELLGGVSQVTERLSRAQLEKRLLDLPGDLNDFYRLIIERIHNIHRRRTFALLELILRRQDSEPALTVSYVWEAVTISECRTYQEASKMMYQSKRTFFEITANEAEERQKADIAIWSGGLVESVSGEVQLMHQTVFEFVMCLSFRHIVLGDLSNIVIENGHSFHFKHRCLHANSQYARRNAQHITYHAELSELTTGNSQMEFIDSLPPHIVKSLIEPKIYSNDSEIGILTFIVSHALLLCLREWIIRSPHQVEYLCNSKPGLNLLSVLYFSLQSRKLLAIEHARVNYYQRRALMANLLLSSGYNLVDDLFFSLVASDIRALEAGHLAKFKIPLPELYKLAVMLLEHGQKPNPQMVIPSGYTTLMHLAPATLVKELIRHGADSNVTDSQGRTPLDYAVDFPYPAILTDGVYKTECRYQKCIILMEAGGFLSQTKYTTWIDVLDSFEMDGYDTTILRESDVAREINKTMGAVLSNIVDWITSRV